MLRSRIALAAVLLTASAALASAAPAFPTSVAHKYGSTVVKQAPVRVVALGLTDQDPLIALGTVPVATREWFGKKPGALFPWAAAKIGKAPLPRVLGFEIDFELVASLEPDLIIALCSALTKEEYQTLSKIAPTIAQPGDVVDWGVSWQASTRTVGQVLGKSAEAEALIAATEARFAAARKTYPTLVGRTAAVLSVWGWPNTYYAYGSQDIRGRFLAGLGMKLEAEVDRLAGASFGASISRERLNLVDLDAAVWLVETADEEKTLKTDALWSKTRAAREGREVFVYAASEAYDALNFCTVLSIPVAIDRVAPLLVKAVDGNPATR